MGDEPPPQFGRGISGRTPEPRPGVYAIALVEDKLLVVRGSEGLFLPGGGVEPGEAPEDALRRELLEETGYALTTFAPLTQARQYVETETGEYINKLCSFFTVMLGNKSPLPAEVNTTAFWLSVDQALEAMSEGASAWAIQVAVDRC